MTFPGADVMNAGIMGDDAFLSTFGLDSPIWLFATFAGMLTTTPLIFSSLSELYSLLECLRSFTWPFIEDSACGCFDAGGGSSNLWEQGCCEEGEKLKNSETNARQGGFGREK